MKELSIPDQVARLCLKQCGKHLQKNLEIADYVESSRSVRLVEEANELTAPSELLGIYRKFGDYPVSRHGAQALWGRETMAGMADGGLAAGGRMEAELVYGMPSFGIGASGHGRDYRLGYGLTVAQGGATHFDLGVYANRRESLAQGGAEHGVGGRLTARW